MPSEALEVMPPQKQLTQPKVFSFAPTNFQEALKFAELLATSDIVPKQYKGKGADILVAMQYGAEVGLQPLQALNSIAVINGRPGLFGDGLLGVILSQPDCLDVEEMDLPEIQSSGKATCTVKRKGHVPVTRTFTLEMARAAKLTEKDGPWKQYPARQLQMRARGFAARDAFADVLRGLKAAEELLDYNDGPTIEGQVAREPEQPDLKITQDEAREFGKAYKATGRTVEDAKAYLAKHLNLTSSLDIRKSQYAKAMDWAKGTPKAEPAVEEQLSRDKEICFELFKILGYDDVRQAKAIQEHPSDWAKLAAVLNKELPTD